MGLTHHLLTGMILQVVKDAQQTSHVTWKVGWGFTAFMAGRGRERRTSTTIGCGNLVFFLNQIVGNDSQSLSHGFFSMGMEKTTRKPQGMHSGKHRNGKWIRIEDVFPSENGIFQPSYVSSPPEALQPTSAVGKNSRGCWHCLSLDASHTSAELLDVWEGCKR